MTFACGLYDRMTALSTGEVRPAGIDLNFIAVHHPRELFDRIVARQEFDASEMSASEYVTRFAAGKCPFVALPAFPSRMFRHGFIAVDSRVIETPKDLQGKRIGVQLYTMTAAVWIRGLLQHDHGVDLSTIDWVGRRDGRPAAARQSDGPASARAGVDRRQYQRQILEPIAGGRRHPGRDRRGPAELDAPLAACEAAVPRFPRGGESLLPPHEDLSDHASRGAAPRAPRAASVRRHQPVRRARRVEVAGAAPHALPRGAAQHAALAAAELDEIDEVFGGDPWPYGVEPNRPTLEALVRFLADQSMIAAPVKLDDLFVPVPGR
jgi:hypothetical protein